MKHLLHILPDQKSCFYKRKISSSENKHELYQLKRTSPFIFFIKFIKMLLTLMKAIKRFFKFISLIVLYLGFSCLAGVLGFLLYGITRDFATNNLESRGIASVPSSSSKSIKTSKTIATSDKPNQPLTASAVTNNPPAPNQSKPALAITAAGVKDKKSLKSFVLKAKKQLEEDYEAAMEDFETKEVWKTSFTHLTIVDFSGDILLNINHPHLEGKNGMEWKNVDGKKIIADMINIGKNSGSGFYECRVRHPDTETLHPKLHYIASFQIEGEPFIVFSGFFLK